MDNQETLCTQDTGRRQSKQQRQKQNKESYRDEQHGPHKKPRVNPDGLEGQTLYASYKSPSMLAMRWKPLCTNKYSANSLFSLFKPES
jgi:hypothetical protein